MTKELWDYLDHKYKAEDARAKKFLVGQFLNFKMVDSKNVISQVQDLQLIIHGIHAERMVLSDSFQVTAIIEKLPLAWLDFKNYLKHKRKEMSVEDLIRRLRIEEDNKSAEKRSSNPNAAKANMVEHDKGSKGKKPKPKPKPGSKLGTKGGVSKKSKFQGKCFNCNKTGHKSSDCRLTKKKGMVTRHVYVNKSAFRDLTSVENGDKIYMGNSETSEIKGQGTVYLKMTSGKSVKLQNVLYVPDICKNLIFGTLQSVHGFKMVFESQKIVLTKVGVLIGKGYVKEGM
ncbi:uncharacterized protein LOC133817193 [Humulus lupulus]|uniref:uncharacterized protein LOC133817193 n=1 Tax=Humulus lupulus TaxID=3486 RepID=UPI002B410240|nr:uncharacterized protein LOC133817193 [Humulus lupulus]